MKKSHCGLYVCVVVDSKGVKSKQTFKTRFSPLSAELRVDVNKALQKYNETHRANPLSFVEVTCYAHKELKYVFPFKKAGYWDQVAFNKSCGFDLDRDLDNRISVNKLNK